MALGRRARARHVHSLLLLTLFMNIIRAAVEWIASSPTRDSCPMIDVHMDLWASGNLHGCVCQWEGVILTLHGDCDVIAKLSDLFKRRFGPGLQTNSQSYKQTVRKIGIFPSCNCKTETNSESHKCIKRLWLFSFIFY